MYTKLEYKGDRFVLTQTTGRGLRLYVMEERCPDRGWYNLAQAKKRILNRGLAEGYVIEDSATWI